MNLASKVLSTFLVGVLGLMTVEVSAQQVPMAPQNDQAQPKISEAQLESFIAASMEMNQVQQGVQQEMIKTIQDEGLDVRKFNEMAAQKQNPSQEISMEISEEDQAAFDSAMEKIQGKQKEMQKEMETVIMDNGLDMAEYQQIQKAYQQDKQLQQRVNQIMQSEQ